MRVSGSKHPRRVDEATHYDSDAQIEGRFVKNSQHRQTVLIRVATPLAYDMMNFASSILNMTYF